MRGRLRAMAAAMALLASGCAPTYQMPGPAVGIPTWSGDHWTTADGISLPLRAWTPTDAPRAVILAVHGMNDYSNFFDDIGTYLATQSIQSYAYDQRGFGAAPRPGIWSSAETMADDLAAAAALVADRHPGLPLYLLGESMGGAVVIVTATSNRPLPAIQGVILSAPAVWGRSSMGLIQRVALWASYHLAPGWTLTGRGLNIQPSDNIDMLRKLSVDPLVIKGTRVDAIKGLVDLMDLAQDRLPTLTRPALVLYGDRDEVVPADPVLAATARLPRLGHGQTLALYPNGFHMLMRDLNARQVWDDIDAWTHHPDAPLPSGADGRGLEKLKNAGKR